MARRMLAPIVSVKHYVQTPVTGVASGANLGITVAQAIAKGAARALVSDVEEGTVIKAIYIEYWASADSAGGTINGGCMKLPGGGTTAPTYAEMQNLTTYENKKNIFAFHQGLGPSAGNIIPIFREWIKIPKGKQRMGLGDILLVKFSFTGHPGDICGFATYKEYE